ncbi:Malate dehydrogenase [hydrothermal vent metagenome]|uniref:Malate dehydrogenase n=1 Tax=hydrothermal vent metagenome TaxID=652676 RepID=A0A1W1BTU5_9ZZZZ
MVGRKVGIVGAGFVGATTAYSLTVHGTCHEVILYDIATDVALGKAIDIGQSTSYSPQGTIVTPAKDASDLKNCDIIVITAGVPRKDGMTREDLLMINANIMKDVVGNIKKYSPNAVILCVANPLDIMTYVIHKMTGWERNRIIGMAGALDGARMAYQIHKKVGYGSGQIKAIVIGDHGQNMIPLPEISTVGGIPLGQLLNQEEMNEISKKTKEGGAEIVKRLGTSAYYAPGRAVAVMVEAILDDSRIVMPSSVILDGEYGQKDVAVGVPVVLGAKGVQNIIELEFNKETQEKFDKSVISIKEGINILKNNNFFE